MKAVNWRGNVRNLSVTFLASERSFKVASSVDRKVVTGTVKMTSYTNKQHSGNHVDEMKERFNKIELYNGNMISYLKERADVMRVSQPVYVVIRKEGEEHAPRFTCRCTFLGIDAEGLGWTIKAAKLSAAQFWVNQEHVRLLDGEVSAQQSIGFAELLRRLGGATLHAGRAASCLLGWEAPDMSTLEAKLSRVALACTQVSMNPCCTSAVIFFLQLATEFGYTPLVLFRKLYELFTDAALCSTQLIQSMGQSVIRLMRSFPIGQRLLGEEVDPGLDPDLEEQLAAIAGEIVAFQSLEIDPNSASVIAGIGGGFAVLLAAAIGGYTDYSPTKGFLKSLAEYGSKVSKLKNGAYAVLAIVQDFSSFVKECVLAFCGQTIPDSIAKAVDSLNSKFRGESVATPEIFSEMLRLNSDEGEELMATNHEELEKGVFVSRVFSEVQNGQIREAFAIPFQASSALGHMTRQFDARIKSASVKQNVGTIRFTPFSIWFYGKPGCGKSTTVSRLSNEIMKVLKRRGKVDDIPGEDMWMHSANFTQEYHTGYNGQYMFRVDDMCQDKPGTLKTSSALQFIQWVSSIPANVTQAALEDKKCPFRSKIMICTSNASHPNREHEITSNAAFLRRRDFLIEMQTSDEVDPVLGWKAKFLRMDPMVNGSCWKQYNSYVEMVGEMIEEFEQHHAEQTRLIEKSTSGGGEEIFDFLDQKQQLGEMEAEQSCMPEWLRLMDQCLSAAERHVRHFANVAKTWKWSVIAAISVGALVFGAYRYATWRKIDVVEAEASYNHEVGRAKPIIAAGSYSQETGRAKPLVAVRSSFSESVWTRNLVKVQWKSHLNSATLNGMFIKQRKLMTCRHFFVGAQEGDQFVVTEFPPHSPPKETVLSFDPKRMVRVPDSEDVVLYDANGNINREFRDISKHFCAGVIPDDFLACMLSVHPERSNVTSTVFPFTQNQAVNYEMGDGSEVCRLLKGFNMQGYHKTGRSGSPLLADEQLNRKPAIFGIQVSISPEHNMTFFEAITQSQIDRALGQFDAVQSMDLDDYVDDEEEWFDAPEEIRDICQIAMRFRGRAPQPVVQPLATKLRKSPVNLFFERLDGEQEYAPAALKDKEVNVLVKSMAGFDRKYGTIHPGVLRKVVSEFIAEDRVVRRGMERRLLNDNEILNGNEGKGLKGVELKTSPGLPKVHERGPHPGKTRWITMEADGKRSMDAESWNELAKMEEALRKGQYVKQIAYACLKDELRSVEKVKALKTRSFIIMPMMMNLLLRKYFGQYIARQHQLAGKISSCVGIDCNSQWTDLYNRLTAMGTDFEDFDYSDWDRSLHADWFYAYATRVNAWYGDADNSAAGKARIMMMDQLAMMDVQIGEWMALTVGGNKSGCALTANINTDVHDMLAYYVYSVLCDRDKSRKAINTLPAFRERVTLALYGDDMVKVTRADVTPWFNGYAMKSVIEELGMVITPADKNASGTFAIKDVSEVTFLKRRFLKLDEDCGLVRAPLDKSVIQRIVLWMHKNDSPIAAAAENIKGALREAFFWGKEFFDDFDRRCLTAWNLSIPETARSAYPQVSYHNVEELWRTGVRGDLAPARYQYLVGDGSCDELPDEEE